MTIVVATRTAMVHENVVGKDLNAPDMGTSVATRMVRHVTLVDRCCLPTDNHKSRRHTNLVVEDAKKPQRRIRRSGSPGRHRSVLVVESRCAVVHGLNSQIRVRCTDRSHWRLAASS